MLFIISDNSFTMKTKVMKKGFDDLYYAVIGAVKILHELHGLYGKYIQCMNSIHSRVLRLRAGLKITRTADGWGNFIKIVIPAKARDPVFHDQRAFLDTRSSPA